MPLLNYTTKIEAIKTAGEIQAVLAKHGAKAVLINYDAKREIESLSFQIDTPQGTISIRLPIDPDATLKVLTRQRVPRAYLDRPQAIRVAWRIVKIWLEAQMAFLETDQVKMEQVFLPYLITNNGQTLFDRMVDTKFRLQSGESH